MITQRRLQLIHGQANLGRCEVAGVDNVMLTASYDGGATWTGPIQVNDNTGPVDEFQPNLTAAPDGTVSMDFYGGAWPDPRPGRRRPQPPGWPWTRSAPTTPAAR